MEPTPLNSNTPMDMPTKLVQLIMEANVPKNEGEMRNMFNKIEKFVQEAKQSGQTFVLDGSDTQEETSSSDGTSEEFTLPVLVDGWHQWTDKARWPYVTDDGKLRPEYAQDVFSVLGDDKPILARKITLKTECLLPTGDDDYGHILELYNQNIEVRNRDILPEIKKISVDPIYIKWMSEKKCLVMTSSTSHAEKILAAGIEGFPMRRLRDGSTEAILYATTMNLAPAKRKTW